MIIRHRDWKIGSSLHKDQVVIGETFDGLFFIDAQGVQFDKAVWAITLPTHWVDVSGEVELTPIPNVMCPYMSLDYHGMMIGRTFAPYRLVAESVVPVEMLGPELLTAVTRFRVEREETT